MDNLKSLLRWMLRRLFYTRRIYYIIVDYLFFTKATRFLHKSIPVVRSEIEHIRYYNFFGRVIFATKEVIALLSHDRIFKKSIFLEGFDMVPLKKMYEKGNNEILWPKSPFVELDEVIVSDDFLNKISLSYQCSCSNNPLNLAKEYVWEEHVNEFKNFYFNEDKNIIKEEIINFRAKEASTAHILVDHFEVLNEKFGYFKSYLKAIDLVLEYHRLSNFVDPAILGSISESKAGNILTPVYRGQRLTHRLLYLSSVMSEIQKYIHFQNDNRKVIVDIGGGFGHMGRFTSNYISNSCYILVELEEMTCFANYFLEYSFPEKHVAVYVDIEHRLDDFTTLVEEYDFIVLPTWLVNKIPDTFVDLYIATGSLAEMPKEYAQMYLDEIDRTLKYDGYFYSNSRVKVEAHKPYLYILYKWKLQSKFLTISYTNHPVNLILETSPQWIGKKIG